MSSMRVALNNISPVFLEKEKIAGSEVWNTALSFSRGERIQIVAPSGSGKTSLVHFIYGLRRDYVGDVLINNKAVKEIQAAEIADLRAGSISIVFQDLRLFDDVSVFQNIAIKRSLNPFHAESKIKVMASRLGIGDKLQQQAGLCSYGEQQRAAIIRALQQPFDFLLMDEPFSHLDEANSRLAMALIEEECAARGAAIIMADLQPVSFYHAGRTLQL